MVGIFRIEFLPIIFESSIFVALSSFRNTDDTILLQRMLASHLGFIGLDDEVRQFGTKLRVSFIILD